MERLWRDLNDKRADVPGKTIVALSDAMCASSQSYSPATRPSLTSFADFVQAVDPVQKALYV
jgi:hypothetical protein